MKDCMTCVFIVKTVPNSLKGALDKYNMYLFVSNSV